ncbi:MAG: glutamate synthase subunit beta [Planctomycetota bacterium]|nr:glutamate synthase subunit beta [Planctomycetota bacterium]
MAKPTGFLEHPREDPAKRPVAERVGDYKEIEQPLPLDRAEVQASRCMDCGIPYCHAFGCPLGNRIPEFTDMVYRRQWRRALDLLHATNNFPEITGRLCPAPCEAACSLSINSKPVSVRHLELQIVERGWREGWIAPQPAERKTGKSVAVIGSGPAGLAAAQQLARRGHDVVVFEKAAAPGGILRYGIPDFKLGKWILDRRLDQLRAEGVRFETGVEVGADLSVRYLLRKFEAICITAGAREPRDLKVPGRGLEGIHFAMEYLAQQNRRNAGEVIPFDQEILARDKNVVVIGGGDTGSDCVGTARRQGARSITQIELLPEPPLDRSPDNPWPTWPTILRTSTSHEEGGERMWSVQTKEFLGLGIRVRGMRCVRLAWSPPDASGRRPFKEVPGSEFELKAELVLLALGFVHVEHGPIIGELGLKTDDRGNLAVDDDGMTNVAGIFAGGDAVLGASLVVRAILLGRRMAAAVDKYLHEHR